MMIETVLSRSLRVMFAGGLAMGSQLALAQEAAAPMQRVEVTGSSLKRVDSETALPVQTMTKAEISRTGATSTQELLTSIAALSSAGSTNTAAGAGVSTYGASTVSLRGLGAERTLVLVNGRRLASFAGGNGAAVDVNAIPLSAIERVEVLKDGASGVYGSDAVAGVVNFILSKQFKGFEITGGAGKPSASGGGGNNKVSVTGGFGDLDADRFAVVLSASHEKEKALFAADRSYARSGNNAPYYTAGATGQGNIEGSVIPGKTGDIRGPNFGPAGSGYGNPLAASGKCDTIQMVASPTPTDRGAPYCAFDSAAFVGLLPERTLSNFTGKGTFKLNATTELFADAMYSESRVIQSFQGSPLRNSFLVTDGEFAKQHVDPALILYPSNPAYQSMAVPYLNSHGYAALVGQPLSISSRVFDFGNRVSDDKSTQSRFVVGARGSVLEQDYEVGFSTSESKVHGTVPGGYFSQVAYARIINDPANNWNPWAAGAVQTGALADKLKAAQYTGDTLNAKSKSTAFDAKITGDLPAVAGIVAQYAVGAQARRDSFATDPSAALESGDIAGLGGGVPPVDRSRTIKSVFAETNVPLTKTLDLGAAVRNDRYDDVGNSTNYKVNARWQPVKPVLLRASAGSGFRAPTLVDLWSPQTLASSATFNDPATHQTNLQVNALSGGNPNLQPEKSKQRSFGMVLAPIDNVTFGFDWFSIKINNVLATPSAQEVVSRFRAGDPAYAHLVTLNGNQVDTVVTTLANTGDATVKGVDVFANYRLNTQVGRFDFALNGTYMDQFDQTSPGGDISHKVGTIADANGDPVLGADNGGIILRWKHVLNGTWSKGPWGVTLTQNYSARYETGNRLDGQRNFIGAGSTYDTNLSYKATKQVTLSAGLRNMFDKQPGVFVPVSNQFQSGYDISQYDPRGRFFYVNAGYRFQ